MRAIVINAKDRTVTETEIDGSLDSLQQIVGGLIEPVSQGLDDKHHCYVNEEGLFGDLQYFFLFKDGHQRPCCTDGACKRDDANFAWVYAIGFM